MFKKIAFPLIFGLALTSYTTYAVLDTFVIENVMGSASFESGLFDTSSGSKSSNSTSKSSSSGKSSSSSKSIDTPSSKSDDVPPPPPPGPGPGTESKEPSPSNDLPGDSSSSSNKEEEKEPVIYVPEDPNELYTEDIIQADNWYSDENINIQLFKETVTVKNFSDKEVETIVYYADVHMKSIQYLRTALAKDKYGQKIVEKTTEMAKRNNAVFAVNGDYYGAQERGYVLRNGTVFRDRRKTEANDKGDLAIYTDGSFEHFKERKTTLEEIRNYKIEDNIKCYQVFAFGPMLVMNGERNVTETDEVAVFSKLGNQRCSIGFVEENHYVFAVCDGRLSDSWGMCLYQMADFMISKGCKTAYNLDGGGSATMYFNGKLINRPNTNGDKDIGEREISDCVYIAR